MISLRTHAISLAAVFLALAVGVVLGSGLFSDTVLSGLRSDKADLRTEINTLTEQKNELNEKLSAASEFDGIMAPRILRDTLRDKSVVVFRTPDAADDDVDAVARLVGLAGATVSSTIGLTPQFVEANSSEKLLSVVNSPIVPAGRQLSTASLDQGSAAGDLLGIALLRGTEPAVPEDQRDTVLSTLRDTGFISYDTQDIGAADSAVIITGGSLGDDAGNRGATVARFAAGMAPHGGGVVLAGRDGSATGTAAVAVTRADAALSDAVSTVDDVDVESGRITTALALSDLLRGGKPGRYGIGQGANSLTVPQ